MKSFSLILMLMDFSPIGHGDVSESKRTRILIEHNYLARLSVKLHDLGEACTSTTAMLSKAN